MKLINSEFILLKFKAKCCVLLKKSSSLKRKLEALQGFKLKTLNMKLYFTLYCHILVNIIFLQILLIKRYYIFA